MQMVDANLQKNSRVGVLTGVEFRKQVVISEKYVDLKKIALQI